jgi:hypothetical protein
MPVSVVNDSHVNEGDEQEHDANNALDSVSILKAIPRLRAQRPRGTVGDHPKFGANAFRRLGAALITNTAGIGHC